METLLWGGLLRMGEALLAGAPTLLVGLLVAGVFRRLLGPETTLRLFGGNTWRSLPQAWAWGMLLPVCSLGVIPVCYELRRAGLSGGATLAFALTAPLFNPLSLLYGLTLSEPIVIVTFACCSLLVVTAVGILWDKLFPGSSLLPHHDSPADPGLRRMASVLVYAAKSVAGSSAGYCLIGLLGSLALSLIFAKSSLTSTMAHGDPTAPLLMLAIAIPAYATPLDVMMQVGSMFVHGNSVGAAFVLLSLGAGANLGLLVWAARHYGPLRAATFLLLFVAVVLAIAYTIEDPLYSAGDVGRPHTHAFDVYCAPFYPEQKNPSAQAWKLLTEGADLYQVISLAGLAVLMLSGAAIRLVEPRWSLENWLLATNPGADRSRAGLNADVSGRTLGLVGIVGLVVLSVVGCYVFYPPAEDCLEDMRIAKADALGFSMSGDVEHAIERIAWFDDLTRKLQIGYFLRHGELRPYQRTVAKALRGRLEQLKDALEDGETQAAERLTFKVYQAHMRCHAAFAPPQ